MKLCYMVNQFPPPKKKQHNPQFSSHVYCGRTAVCIRIPLGTEVGLILGDIVLDGDPAPLPEKRAQPTQPVFGRCQLWLNSWMGQDATWYGGKPRRRQRCVRWGRSSPKMGHSPPVFGSCLVWPNSWMDEHTTWCGSRHGPRPHQATLC